MLHVILASTSFQEKKNFTRSSLQYFRINFVTFTVNLKKVGGLFFIFFQTFIIQDHFSLFRNNERYLESSFVRMLY